MTTPFKNELCPAAYPHLGHHWRNAARQWARCPGRRIDSDTRARLVTTRHIVLRELRQTKERLARRIAQWDCTGTMIEGDEWVPRRVDEFPENSIDAWTRLIDTVTHAAEELRALRLYAERQRRAVQQFESRQNRGGAIINEAEEV